MKFTIAYNRIIEMDVDQRHTSKIIYVMFLNNSRPAFSKPYSRKQQNNSNAVCFFFFLYTIWHRYNENTDSF